MKAIAATLLYALLAIPAGAQTDCRTTVKVNADSAARAHLPSTRLTAYQQRALARLDSLAVAHCPLPPSSAACDSVRCPSYAVSYYYASAKPYFPITGADTVTKCAVITGPAGPTSRRRLAWPPIRETMIGDSARVQLRDGELTLTEKCGFALTAAGLTDTTRVTVTWKGEWVTLAPPTVPTTRRVFRYFLWVP